MNSSDEINKKIEIGIDALARLEHERWAHWQSYLHSMCRKMPDGSLSIPSDLVSRWEIQINTPYENLTEEEKNSDKDQVRRYIPTIVQLLTK